MSALAERFHATINVHTVRYFCNEKSQSPSVRFGRKCNNGGVVNCNREQCRNQRGCNRKAKIAIHHYVLKYQKNC